MIQPMAAPRISVIIPTFNRACLLRASLESLTRQTLPATDFEVVVVNDGSSDQTEDVCKELASRLRLRYLSITNSGISAAKNLGIFAAIAPLLLFFDDDDIATPTLLEEHLKAHRQHPEENVAILGYTTWAPSIAITPVMEYILDIGQQLFAYKNLKHGQRLDYTYFWGGRTSCKRSFLTAHGIFNQSFRAIIEDIELGYRLSHFNLAVVFHRRAVSHMVRPITFDDFCRRCERLGAALHLFRTLHADASVQQYCQSVNAESWKQHKHVIGIGFYRVRELEAEVATSPDTLDLSAVRSELHKLYGWMFNAFKVKGMVDAQRASCASELQLLQARPIVDPVVIYQMGKVGSKTIEASLKASGYPAPVCHAHLMHDLDGVEANVKRSRIGAAETLREISHGRQLIRTLLGSKYIRCRVISLVRDPLARNISAFFQNITDFVPGVYDGVGTQRPTIKALRDVFINTYEHGVPATWFQKQLEPVFGFDVFASAFPKTRGYAIYKSNNATLLLIKLEKLHECARDAMRDYLGADAFTLVTTNVADDKDYKDLYKAFLREAKFSEGFLNEVYGSQMCRHFYSYAEIEQFKARWLKRTPCLVAE